MHAMELTLTHAVSASPADREASFRELMRDQRDRLVALALPQAYPGPVPPPFPQ